MCPKLDRRGNAIASLPSNSIFPLLIVVICQVRRWNSRRRIASWKKKATLERVTGSPN
ncbi:MAG: hypothetical protein SW833_15210 [Cyanobacteriota bacterium]|nr:hypothetical protein [Cyanobacteriota bacterium]